MRETVTAIFGGRTEADDDNYGVILLNFPILPVGSRVSLDLDPEIAFEFSIKEYMVCNIYGLSVNLEFEAKAAVRGETWDRLEKISLTAKEAGGQLTERYYPHVVDFGKVLPPLWMRSIETLQISARAKKALLNGQINTIEELASRTSSDLLCLDGFRKTNLLEVQIALSRLGRKLSEG
jgi:hypothetical protein